jgi:putative NADH-flavin reductase
LNILLLGATGRVGKEIAARALTVGHIVNALVRNPDAVIWDEGNLHIMQGDACNESDIRLAMQGTEAVISSLSTDGGTVLTESTPHLIAAMKEQSIRRIVTIGTAGILQSREYPELLRYESPDSRRSSTRAAEEHRHMWELLRVSGLDWTIVCPTYLPDGERLGLYRVERDFLPEGGQSISVPDTADFAYQQLFSRDYVGCRVGIAY